jgi:hypothetical protein
MNITFTSLSNIGVFLLHIAVRVGFTFKILQFGVSIYTTLEYLKSISIPRHAVFVAHSTVEFGVTNGGLHFNARRSVFVARRMSRTWPGQGFIIFRQR